jgi:lysophospholipase L1-like esterase
VSPARRRIAKALLLAASTVLAVLLLELVMRVYLFGADGLSYAKMRSLHSLGRSGLIRASEHQDILYELEPNLDTFYKCRPFVTDSRGLRDRAYAVAKPPNTFRVAVLGDSFTMGSGVSLEETYHAFLEARLEREAPGRRYEFINFGVSGYYLSQYLAVLRHKALAYDPDLVLVGFFAGNDMRVPPADKFSRPYRVKAVRNAFFKLHSFSLAGDIWKYSIAHRFKSARLDPAELERIRREQRAYVDATFAEMATLLRPLGIPLAIAYLDNAPRDPTVVRDLAGKHGFTFIDTTAAFEGRSVLEYTINPTDKHPNGKANRLIADAIHAGLVERDLLEPRRAVAVGTDG